jgi:hypothetical protein
MSKKKRYLVQEVPPGMDADRLKAEEAVQDEEIFREREAFKRANPGVVFPEPGAVFDAMIRDEMEKEEAKKPPVMTGPHDLAAVLLGHLGGLDAAAEPSQVSFPIRVGPAEAETDYKVVISLRAENRRTLADVINTAIRAGQQDIIAGPVVLYLYAVQGHEQIKTSENGLPCVELKYIFRLRETTPKQEV